MSSPLNVDKIESSQAEEACLDWTDSPDDLVLAAIKGLEDKPPTASSPPADETKAGSGPTPASGSCQAGSQRPGSQWFSAFGQRASAFGSKAVQAIASEAKLFAADAKDFQAGVREGWQLTAQDARQFGERIRHAREEKTSSGECQPGAATSDASTSSSSSAAAGEDGSERPEGLAAIRQGLAITAETSKDLWRDVRESAPEAVRDLREGILGVHHKLLGLRGRSSQDPSQDPASPARQDAKAGTEEAVDNDLFEIGSDDELDEPFDFLDGNTSDGTSVGATSPRLFSTAAAKKMNTGEVPEVQPELPAATSSLTR